VAVPGAGGLRPQQLIRRSGRQPGRDAGRAENPDPAGPAAFAAGIAVGAAIASIEGFSFAFFIPIYFAIVGLRLDLLHGFSIAFFLLFLLLACAIKAGSVCLGARLAGETSGSSVNLAVALNARGGPGIVVASVAYAAGIIGQPFYAALVMLAIVTSLLAGSWLARRAPRPHDPAHWMPLCGRRSGMGQRYGWSVPGPLRAWHRHERRGPHGGSCLPCGPAALCQQPRPSVQAGVVVG